MRDIILLDGGIGQELLHRSGDKPTPLWATQVMLDHPGIVENIHRDYFEAGATIATSNTYALHHDRLVGTLHEGKLHDYVSVALNAVNRAAEGRRSAVRIAGSIGPLIASYRPDLHPKNCVSVLLYRELVELVAPRVDVILFETVSSVKHALTALTATLNVQQKPVWISVTVDDEDGTRLRSGESLSSLADLQPKPDAWMANCSAPEAMSAALDVLKTFGRPFGAYANGFKEITKAFLKDKPTVDALSSRPDITPALYADFVMKWVDAGATIVGGCCETSPAHIRTIANRLHGAKYNIV